MGYQIKALNTREINDRVSSEKIIPSLFWLIPIGDDWQQYELEDAYFKFNDPQNKSRTKILSNFFVKGDPDAEPAKRRKKALSLSDQSNEFSKLLSSLDIRKSKTILIICSSYPQPGWGLLVKVENLEETFERLESVLSSSKFDGIVDLGLKMYEYYVSINEIKNQISGENINNINSSTQFNIFNTSQVEVTTRYTNIYPLYIAAANKLIEEVMKISPIALIEIERSKLFDLQIIATDEPRMIGWKTVLALSNRISAISLADYLNREYSAEIEMNEINPVEKLDGDVFTDYLHHILISNSSKFGDKRKVAEKLLFYFNYDQRKEIVDYYNLPHECVSNNSKLLSGLGWNEPKHDYFDTSLISYFEKDELGHYYITNTRKETYSQLRVSFESYLKDLLRIIEKHITSDENKLHQLILLKHPKYKKPIKFTAGSLCMVIHSLGSYWKAENDWDNYYKIISNITGILNEDGGVHHNELIKRDDAVVASLNPLFNDLFKLTKEVFTIMPMHFRPTSNFMSNLYTGMAWAHDLKDKKEIRVLIWDSEKDISFDKELLIWNPSKINPVLTNYKRL
jgi:hypothetical protein